ncbi:MAG: dinitrogenase iron-molybdenum cofactor biosynthesis protein [Clostridiales bacterium]|jgi:predicted Fe-Mo cluster-binding NifX family protein|nr:dinitrogenase iron-molybdenum cofactor biosynthesis protein [Clostridiales bacterium]
MGMRVAVATTDGKVINEHFGRASAFYIMEADASGHSFVEKRETAPVCGDGGHEDTDMDALIDLLSDCEAVLASRVGPGAERALARRGITAYEIPLPVSEAMDRLGRFYAKRKPPVRS